MTDNYRLVEINGQKYTEFTGRCLNEGCKEKFYFQSLITINSHIHYNFSRNQEIEIIDEVKLEQEEINT